MVAVGWDLARADLLAPKDYAALTPVWLRLAGVVGRAFGVGQARTGRPGERLARVLERHGPVAIKLGQLLSTRADVFGAQFAMDLSHLKDRLPAFPLAQARASVEAALGQPVETLFDEFAEAVAAASLAQVHRARLKDGRAVAVKVLRPDVERLVARDISAMTVAAGWVERWSPAAKRLEPRSLARTVARSLELELDLRFEAAGADELRLAMRSDGFMDAPAVVWPGVARRVLTLEWVDGDPLSDDATLRRPGLDGPRLATSLIRAFLSQALEHGVFHADLHEGNLFIDADGRPIAVDFGIVGRLGASERRYLAEILWGFIRRDYARVADVHFDAGYVSADHDRAAFAQALRAVGEPIFGRTASDVSMSRLLTQLFEVTALFDMRLRPELVLLQKTMLTVEGVARRVDPALDIWAAAEPVVRRWITREMSPTSRLRELGDEVTAALRRIGRDPPPAVQTPPGATFRLDPVSLVLGALAAATVFAAAALTR